MPRDKFQKVMREFEAGTLDTSAGKKVTSRKQAQAIAHSEEERAKKGSGHKSKKTPSHNSAHGPRR